MAFGIRKNWFPNLALLLFWLCSLCCCLNSGCLSSFINKRAMISLSRVFVYVRVCICAYVRERTRDRILSNNVYSILSTLPGKSPINRNTYSYHLYNFSKLSECFTIITYYFYIRKSKAISILEKSKGKYFWRENSEYFEVNLLFVALTWIFSNSGYFCTRSQK